MIALHGTTLCCLIDRVSETLPQSTAASEAEALKRKTIDIIGRGTCRLVTKLPTHGVAARGLGRSAPCLAACQSCGLDEGEYDLRGWPNPRRPAEVGVFLEVTKHLPATNAQVFQRFLASLGGAAEVTAAARSQGGIFHVNERPHNDWMKRFAQVALLFNEQLPSYWCEAWCSRGVTSYYWKRLMNFRPERCVVERGAS